MPDIREVIGWVDGRNRPLINLRASHQGEDVVVRALIDTGFNGTLLWEVSPAAALEFPGEISSLYEAVEVAGGSILVALATMLVDWFDEPGRHSPVETLVSLNRKARTRGEPQALLGTAMLSGKTLSIDFAEGTLRIQAPA